MSRKIKKWTMATVAVSLFVLTGVALNMASCSTEEPAKDDPAKEESATTEPSGEDTSEEQTPDGKPSEEEQPLSEAYIASLMDSGCKKEIFDNYESKAWDNETQTMFSICLEGNVAKCKFEDLVYACDFPPANVDLTTEGNNIYIVEYPSSDMADCLCTADVSFDIMNIESGEYCLYIYRGNEKGEHGDNPRLKQTIVLKQGEEIRMQYPF